MNIDSRFAAEMWRSIAAAGEEFGITPYGTETMHVLRAEKGFVIVGQDTDGSVTPVDLRMNWMMWIPCQFLNFRFIAPQFQVLFANVVALVWNTFLSWRGHVEQQRQDDDDGGEGGGDDSSVENKVEEETVVAVATTSTVGDDTDK